MSVDIDNLVNLLTVQCTNLYINVKCLVEPSWCNTIVDKNKDYFCISHEKKYKIKEKDKT